MPKLFLTILVTLLAFQALAREQWPGQYSQMEPELRFWFNNQRNPTTKIPCCSTADGSYVEEDIRDGHYWVRFDKTNGEWREVPDDVVIRDPNKNGAAVVWYYYESGIVSPRMLKFRCFSPGAGL